MSLLEKKTYIDPYTGCSYIKQDKSLNYGSAKNELSDVAQCIFKNCHLFSKSPLFNPSFVMNKGALGTLKSKELTAVCCYYSFFISQCKSGKCESVLERVFHFKKLKDGFFVRCLQTLPRAFIIEADDKNIRYACMYNLIDRSYSVYPSEAYIRIFTDIFADSDECSFEYNLSDENSRKALSLDSLLVSKLETSFGSSFFNDFSISNVKELSSTLSKDNYAVFKDVIPAPLLPECTPEESIFRKTRKTLLSHNAAKMMAVWALLIDLALLLAFIINTLCIRWS